MTSGISQLTAIAANDYSYRARLAKFVLHFGKPKALPTIGRRSSSFPVRLTLLFLATAMLLMTVQPAISSDFYLRMGAGFDFKSSSTFMDENCSPAAGSDSLYGCGSGPYGTRGKTTGKFGVTPAIELGIGYTAAPFRFEFLVEHRPNINFIGLHNFSIGPNRKNLVRRREVTANVSTVAAILAVNLDISDPILLLPEPYTPFVGFGIGIVRTALKEKTLNYPIHYTAAQTGKHTDSAYMAVIGVSRPIDESLSIEFAWRYTDYGRVRVGRGPGKVIFRDPKNDDIDLALAPIEARLRSNSFRTSLRYQF